MRKTYAKQTVICRTCPRATDAPRHGLCFACYQRVRRGSALPAKAACEQCGETDRVVLRKTPHGILCANDHARTRAAVA
jgi:NMD protein affecting ribosome stability and mRNA decay